MSRDPDREELPATHPPRRSWRRCRRSPDREHLFKHVETHHVSGGIQAAVGFSKIDHYRCIYCGKKKSEKHP